MKTPGIMETTEAKPTAAKGICQRRDTGVMTTPTAKHATNAPIGAPAPNVVSFNHLMAWATAPTAIGHGSIFRGEEKKILKQATATPAAMKSLHRETALPTGSAGIETPRSASPTSSPVEIATTTSTA